MMACCCHAEEGGPRGLASPGTRGGCCAVLMLMLSTFSAAAAAQQQQQQLALASIFSDGMILQRASPTALFGVNATALSDVTVVVEGHDGARLGSGSGHADANGTWVVELAAPFIGANTNTTVSIRGDTTVVTLRGVAWGDIVLCGGQSNMGFGMCGTQNGKNDHHHVALDSVDASAKRGTIRLFDMLGVKSPGIGGCNTSAGIPSVTPPQQWFSPTAATLGDFSAICALTAQQL